MMNEKQRKRFAGALARLSNDGEMLGSLAAITSEDAPGLLRQLENDLNADQWEAYAKTAHAVKGLLSTFETGEPVSELQLVIDAARQSDGKTVKTLHASIRPKLDELLLEIEGLTT
jgi:hypothetical protein